MPPKVASAPASTAPPKPTGTWDNVEFLNDLLVAFYQAGNQASSFGPQVNIAIVEFLTAQGYDISWSAIRFILPLLSPSSPFSVIILTTLTLTTFYKPAHLLQPSISFSTSPPCTNNNKMVSSRQLMKWDPQVHEDILIAVFHNLTLSTEDWTRVMKDLKEMGYSFSESALR
ncbi:hypothetical protein V8C42DRAFT_346160 [Trichoderma barbatum]